MRAGFTLIEMSIVLVIIGLIVGGVLVGQSLILQAQLRSTMKQIESYKTAVMTFKDKYSCMPGDCANATSFWPADPACSYYGSRPYMAAPNGMTCNGDGNGIIYGTEFYEEKSLFWQHLSLAGLIQGTFTGTCGMVGDSCTANGDSFSANLDVPTAPIGSAMVILENPQVEFPGDTRFYSTAGQHVFWMGTTNTKDGSGNPIIEYYANPVLTPNQAYQLDSKYDNGLPGSGAIMDGFGARGNNCENVGKTPPAYQTHGNETAAGNADAIGCSEMFLGGF
jgi:prepilin-type N-terminal cleavage/methylation domain-containing protein